MKKVQGVFVIVDEVDALPRDIYEPEQGASSVVHIVQQNLSNLMSVMALHFGLHQISVSAVDGQDVSVGRNLQAEGTIQSTALRDRRARSVGRVASKRILDGDDAVVESVGDIEHLATIVCVLIMAAQGKSRRSDYQARLDRSAPRNLSQLLSSAAGSALIRVE